MTKIAERRLRGWNGSRVRNGRKIDRLIGNAGGLGLWRAPTAFFVVQLLALRKRRLCPGRLAWSRTPPFQGGDHGIEAHPGYQQATALRKSAEGFFADRLSCAGRRIPTVLVRRAVLTTRNRPNLTSGKEVKDVAQGGRIALVDLGIAALLAGYRHKFLVLHIKQLGEIPAGSAELVRLVARYAGIWRRRK